MSGMRGHLSSNTGCTRCAGRGQYQMGRLARPCCFGCKLDFAPRKLTRGPRNKRRCGACQRAAARWRAEYSRAGTGLPEHRKCSECDCRGCCLPTDSGGWLCWSCRRVALLADGKVVLHATGHGATADDIADLAGDHLEQCCRIDVWVIALEPVCVYRVPGNKPF